MKARVSWGLLVVASFGAACAEACPTGAFGSRDGGLVVFSSVAGIPAPGLRYLFLDGRRGSTLDAGSPVRCKDSTVEVRTAESRWVSWSRIGLTQTDTTFPSVETRLAGRLIEPADSTSRMPLVVMVHGSERTPALGSPYASLLAAQGVRVFAYDKRGTGASEGEYTQNFELLAEDAARALAHARTMAAGRFDRAGYFGGSQGGWVAPLAATRAPVDFVAIGFGLVVSPIEEDREQMLAEARAAGLGAGALDGIERLSRATAELLNSHFEKGYEALDAIRRDPSTRTWARQIAGEHSGAMLRTSDADLRRFGRARFDNLELAWNHDAAAVLERLNVPMLWILAADDREAPIDRTRELLSSFASRGKPIETWVFPDTDHGMVEFTTRQDGSRQVTRITDGYLRLLGDWVRGRSSDAYGRGERLTSSPTPARLVQAHANAWSTGDLAGLMATLHDDVRSYDRSRDPFKLDGPLSDSIGSKQQFETYYRETYAKQPPSRERITATAAVADIVVIAGESAQPPDFTSAMRFLTAYRIDDGRIRDLWHLAWRPPAAPTDPDTADVIRRLNAARLANDEKSAKALFDPQARHFCPSGSPRSLPDRPCATSSGAVTRTELKTLFAVGELVVEQSRAAGIDRLSIYRVREGRILATWLLTGEAQAAEKVVLAYLGAVQDGDAHGVAAMSATGFESHQLPAAAHVLEGREARVDEPAVPREVHAMASVGDLVVARVATHLKDSTDPDHTFTAFRVDDGKIAAVWRIAHERDADPDSGADALRTARRLVEAHNRGDADAFVALYHAQARHAHARHDRTRLGGGVAKPTTTPAQRKQFYRDFYAKKPPTPVEIVASVALGEWVATRERYFEADGSRRDHLTIYRVRNGLIVDDWHLAP